MRIIFLYSADCPSHDEALERLRKSLKLEQIKANIEIVEVRSDEEAERRRFVGSPTIVVNGRDIDPPAQPHYALTCRAYTLEDGRISPLPSENMIRTALRKARDKEQ